MSNHESKPVKEIELTEQELENIVAGGPGGFPPPVNRILGGE